MEDLQKAYQQKGGDCFLRQADDYLDGGGAKKGILGRVVGRLGIVGIEGNGGYSQPSLGYRLYNPTSKKFTVQKHVIFNEDSVWPWNNNGTKEPMLGPTYFSDPFPTILADEDNDLSPSLTNQDPSTSTPHPDNLNHPSTLPNHQSHSSQSNSSPSHNNTPTGQQPSSATTPSRPKRTSRPPGWLKDYHSEHATSAEETQLFALNISDPTSYAEAAPHP
ncbi:hypothetical protein E3N88_08551 [Mikania micrantha]|uniref:Retroviral polymerase SH3-like domain-containing protein n=1 Tax=Mikania micrantha TaxID=192012 RepID=A0A5N6PJM5_9ASTR|nr:hypothetical protein E3N88_08551 [Mikania micrantha]